MSKKRKENHKSGSHQDDFCCESDICNDCMEAHELQHCHDCHQDLPLSEFPHKLCPKCGEYKPHWEFYQLPGRPDGLSGWCRECHRATGRHKIRKIDDDPREDLVAKTIVKKV